MNECFFIDQKQMKTIESTQSVEIFDDYLWLHIFSFVPLRSNLMMTCKKFCEIVRYMRQHSISIQSLREFNFSLDNYLDQQKDWIRIEPTKNQNLVLVYHHHYVGMSVGAFETSVQVLGFLQVPKMIYNEFVSTGKSFFINKNDYDFTNPIRFPNVETIYSHFFNLSSFFNTVYHPLSRPNDECYQMNEYIQIYHGVTCLCCLNYDEKGTMIADNVFFAFELHDDFHCRYFKATDSSESKFFFLFNKTWYQIKIFKEIDLKVQKLKKPFHFQPHLCPAEGIVWF